jgi:Tol biopolymer transport system component
MPPTNAYILARCDRDGKNTYLISCNNEPDYVPSVGNDGRIIYTRWEYTDKPLWRAEKLWTVNPDGTKNRLVTTFGGVQRYGRFSPDGTSIVFCQGPTERGPWELYTIPAAGGTPVKVTEDGSDMNPDWK